MHGLVGERVLMRIHIGERDKWNGRPVDLPLVVECVDTEEKINAILPELDEMLDGGLITLEKAKVITYRAHQPD